MKGQASLEFAQGIAILLAIFVALTPFIYAKYSEGQQLQLRNEAQLVADTVANEINTANAVGRGYRRAYDLQPYLLDQYAYTVLIFPTEQQVYVNWTDALGAGAPINTGNVSITRNPSGGENIVENRDETIILG